MVNGINLSSGVYQNDNTPSGDWDILKKDTDNLIKNIDNTISKIVDNNNVKIQGYKNSLSNLTNKLEKFKSGIDNKNGIVKPDDDDYTVFLENRYYVEKEKSELEVLSNTVNVLILTKEI